MRILKYIIPVIIVHILASCTKTVNGNNTNVTTVPIPPSELNATVVSTTQINLNWIDKSTNEIGFKLERKTSGTNFTVIANLGADITTFNDNSLNPNTTYTYRVFSYNSVGSSLTYSNEVTASTHSLPTLTTTPVTNLSALDGVSGGTITSEGGASVSAKGVVWSTSPNPTISLSTKTSDGTGIGTFVSTMYGLTANTRYYVRAYATNSAGTGYGNEIIFTTNNINIKNGLIGYFPFSGNAGDSSGYNNHGTVVGAKLSSDRFGINDRSYLFNRSTDNYISIKTSKLFDTLKNVSISLWVKVNSYNMPGQAGYNHFINKTDGTNHQFIFANNGTQLYFYNGPSLNQLNSTKNLPPLNKWSLLVLTYFYESGNSQSSCKFYIDGNLVDSFTTNSNLTPNTANIRIGDYMSLNHNRVDGNIDDIRIYNRPLTIDEIKYLFSMTGS